MLKSFTVNNFKAFKDSVTIDFSKIGNYEFNTEALKNKLIKTSVMYGNNASGKSSIGLALFDIVLTLTNNFKGKENYVNYKNLLSQNEYSSFSYTFIFSGKEIIYSYVKENATKIISEKLTIGSKVVIDYDKRNENGKLLINMNGIDNLNIDLKTLNISILRYIKSNCILKDDEENRLFFEFYDFVNKMLLFCSLESRGFIGYCPTPANNIIDDIVNKGHFEELQKFFKDASFEDEITYKNILGTNQLLVKFNDQEVDFNLVKSSGMSSLLRLYYWLMEINDKEKSPSFIFIDGFDSFYHYNLSTFIIEKFKKADCQVVLTTHNTALLTNDLLRPDCYYICSKTRIENLNNRTIKDIRFGNNLEKLYKGGAFSY